ncbi:hypothetical protein H0H81_000699 [Sphagnurus paluster]|uniref:Uncharacterized protein n=1 Tax=Sphagnurus paluster TaxID=117069 RepID=A0A9P7GUY8_9AGAR|nr:hypothetical protein H0H81_000699 [Sphagnurus paluster]
MGFLPFSLSYLMLTPRRVELPTEVVPQSTRVRASSNPTPPNGWSKHFTLNTKSFRSIRGLSSTAAGKRPALGQLEEWNNDQLDQPSGEKEA